MKKNYNFLYKNDLNFISYNLINNNFIDYCYYIMNGSISKIILIKYI